MKNSNIKIIVIATLLITIISSCTKETDKNLDPISERKGTLDYAGVMTYENNKSPKKNKPSENYYWAGRFISWKNSRNIKVKFDNDKKYNKLITECMAILSGLSKNIDFSETIISQNADIIITSSPMGFTSATLPTGDGNVGNRIHLGKAVSDNFDNKAYFWNKRFVIHEFLHTLGFNHINLVHESNSNTADSFIINGAPHPTAGSILYSKIDEYAHGNKMFELGDYLALDQEYRLSKK